jgi:tetratricopeptide (TPR) repeat protein
MTNDESPSANSSRPGSRRWFALRRCAIVIVIAGAALAGGVAWYVWHPRQAELPLIDLTGSEPEVKAAIEQARGEVQQSPHAAEAWGKFGMVLVAHQFYTAGNTCFAEAARLDPAEARWPYLHGLTLLLSDGEAAVVPLDRAVQLEDGNSRMRLLLAEILLTQGRTDESERNFRKVLQREPDNARALLGLGRIAHERGDLASSRDLLTRCGADPSSRKTSARLLAEIHHRSGDSASAARELGRAERLPDDQPWNDPIRDEVDRLRVGKQSRLERADRDLADGRVDAALSLLRQTVSDYPSWHEGWLKLGRTLTELQEFAEAEHALSVALRLAPESVEAHFHLGVALFQQGRFDEAEEQFRSATKLKPDFVLAHYNRGHSLARLGKSKDAIAAFREVLNVRPAFAAAHSSLGELLAREGENSLAREHLRRAIELNPDDKAAIQLLEKLSR